MDTPARRFGQVAGSGYAGIALLGFALTGLDGFASSTGASLFGLRVNPLHNSLHLLIGLALIVSAARGEDDARTICLLVAVAYGVVGLLGLALVGTDGNVLALNHADNVLHLGTAAAAAAATILSPAVRAPTPAS